MEEVSVVIVGAGPSGLATAACLATHSIPYLLLERDDCIASLWLKRSYDRLTLHLTKHFSQLPYAPHPPSTPTYIPKKHFIEYLAGYASRFHIQPRFHRHVKSAAYDESASSWRIQVANLETGVAEEYAARFLVVASGENSEIVVPEIAGMESFPGEVIHSSQYGAGKEWEKKAVLVVGAGNSGMEIAFDLAERGAKTSIVVRSPIHIVSRSIWYIGALMVKYLPLHLVDKLVLFLCYIKYGDTSNYGIKRPRKGPFYLKFNTATYPVFDVGTAQKIKSGEIQVLPPLTSIQGSTLMFEGGKAQQFNAIVFATGYKSTVKNWLKSDDHLIGEDGMAKQKFPNHWKGKNGVYCAGLVRRGIYGASDDAEKIAIDIKNILHAEK